MRTMLIVVTLTVLAVSAAGKVIGAQAETGTLVINVVDKEGNRLAGACYRFPDPISTAFAVCDDGDGDVDSTAGRIEVRQVLAGGYEMGQVTAPDGYQLVMGENEFGFTVTAEEVTEIDVVYQELNDSTAIADLTERIDNLEAENKSLRERLSKLERQGGATTGGEVVTISDDSNRVPAPLEFTLDCDILRGLYADSGNPYDKDYRLRCWAP